MNSEDGQVFVKNLAQFIRTHERALANALQHQHQRSKHGQQASAGAASISSSTTTAPTSSSSTSTAAIPRAVVRPFINLTTPTIRPSKLTLTPHHLYYLLSKYEELGVNVGHMNVRLENIHADNAPGNYVSFLGQAPKTRGRPSDADSLHSVSSVRSVMSSVSSVWSTLTLSNSAAKAEKRIAQQRDDIRYLYSCFTKIPALRLSPDPATRLIAGYEEFPFDTAVPLWVFKNLGSLEICDLDFRQFYGWDTLAKQLRSLTVRRAHVEEPLDLLLNVVLDDMDKRRRRSSRAPVPTTPSTPGAAWPSSSPRGKYPELARSTSAPNSPVADQRRISSAGSPGSSAMNKVPSTEGRTYDAARRSGSPARPLSSRHASTAKTNLGATSRLRGSSASSGSSVHESTPRHSTTDLIGFTLLPSNMWQFLRHLSLADNGLHHVTAASLAPVAGTLQSLDLSGNLFNEVPDALASLTHLRALNLSNCMIESLRSLSRNPLPAITTLNLRSNRLLSLSGIDRLFSLEKVDLRENRLHDPTELARLTSVPELTHVYVAKNPFTRTHASYRITIFNLFRSTPRHGQEDIVIDQLGPASNERKKLIDWAPEPPSLPVIKPAVEDENSPPAPLFPATAAYREPIRAIDDSYAHRRSISDVGAGSSQRRRRAGRRRVVELSQPALSSPRAEVTTPGPPSPLREVAPKPESESEEPVTPDAPVYNVASTTQGRSATTRPMLDTALSSQTPAPRIRDPSDDDDSSPLLDAQELGSNTDLYRQKLAALRTDLGPNWLTALNENRFDASKQDARSFSPASRTSTIRPDNASHGISVGGRTLG